MQDTYSKIVFLSEEAEKEWNEAPEGVKKLRDKLLQQNLAETQAKIQQEMEAKAMQTQENHCIEFWRRQTADYQWLYQEQKDICDGYRKIIMELKEEIEKLKLKK